MTTDRELLQCAWDWQKKAHAWKSGTKVGCAIETQRGNVVGGCNIEGLWMTSIHAETSAIVHLVTDFEDAGKGMKVAIVSNAKHFTPCGACCDWLFQFCNPDAIVFIQNNEFEITKYELRDLMPHYPRQ